MNSEEYKKDYKEQLSTLLDTTYELEGLIKLALNEEIPGDVFSKLIMRKVEAMLGQAQEALDSAGEYEVDADEAEGYHVEAEDDSEELYSEEDVEAQAETEAGEDLEADVIEAEVEPQEPPVYDDPEKTPVEVKSEKKQVAPRQAEPHRQAPNLNTPLRMFSINDRFRFRRELFGGSDQAMRMALETVAEFEAFSESEEYFYSELGWNPERPEVAEFMSIVAGYFSKR